MSEPETNNEESINFFDGIGDDDEESDDVKSISSNVGIDTIKIDALVQATETQIRFPSSYPSSTSSSNVSKQEHPLPQVRSSLFTVNLSSIYHIFTSS
ncbi:unnamed protein product [Lactuca saligna]|uniref:Uncharacterized protein n=1 Tax=Lactuca saligna TaxID=75948 RepID=A0AA35ZJD0_LACSI|nr:unnamed protein product [Lactuca saligna]